MTILNDPGLGHLVPRVHSSRILVLGERPSEAAVLSTILASGQLTCVVEAPSQRDPVTAVQALRADLVLLDLASASPDDAHLLGEVRAATTGGGLPLLVVTDGTPERRAEALGAGADDVLAVPLVAEELLARVRAWLMIRLFSGQQPGTEPGRQTTAQQGPGQGPGQAPGRASARPHGPEEPAPAERPFLEAMVDSMEEAVIACGEDGRTLLVNSAALRLGLGTTALPQPAVVSPGRLRSGEGRELTPDEDPLRRAWARQEVVSIEVTIGTAQRGMRTLMANARPIPAHGDRPRGAVVTLHDISEQRRVVEELRRDVMFDEVTGLPNSALFFELATRAVARTAREHQPFSVIVIVLNRVEELTDFAASSGPAPFYPALAALADRLPGLLRPGDIAARLDDGFVLLCSAPVIESNAQQIVARLEAGLSRPLEVAGRRLTVSLSFGAETTYDANRPVQELTRGALARVRRAGTRPATSPP